MEANNYSKWFFEKVKPLINDKRYNDAFKMVDKKPNYVKIWALEETFPDCCCTVRRNIVFIGKIFGVNYIQNERNWCQFLECDVSKIIKEVKETHLEYKKFLLKNK